MNHKVISHEDMMKSVEQLERRKLKELKEASMPLIKYLNENHHPMITAIVTPTSVELVEGLMNIPKIYDHVKD